MRVDKSRDNCLQLFDRCEDATTQLLTTRPFSKFSLYPPGMTIPILPICSWEPNAKEIHPLNIDFGNQINPKDHLQGGSQIWIAPQKFLQLII